MLILGSSASEIVPALVEFLKDRDSINRPSLVNSFTHIGPSSIQVIPIALEDLNSALEQIRQQGVILLGSAASYDDGALNAVIAATKDWSDRVAQSAIYILSEFVFDSKKAAVCLHDLKENSDYRHSSYVR
ncbi:MAG TPA: hypothetical protein EYQ50_19825 [Verrucomicrobiales bacterium]|nr:hypothetical protein [Verrucomicrobiales bacterium]